MVRDETIDEAKARDRSTHEGPSGWSYQRVGLALFLLIVVAIGGAFILDRQFKPPVGIEPALGTQATPLAGVMPTAPVPSAVPSGVTMPSDPLEREIVEAYLHYWDVRIRAFYTLDTTLLTEVLADPKLSREQQQIRDYAAQGRAAKLDVEHHAVVIDAKPDYAVVYDEYVNRSVFVDSSNKTEFTTPTAAGVAKISYVMRKLDGKWKVVDGQQHE